MQHSHKQQQEKQKALQEELQTLRQKTEREKEEQGLQDQEALALLTQKAERAEESARQFSVKLQEKVSVQRSCGAVLDPGIFERLGGRACDSDAQMGNDSASMFAKIMGVVCGRSCIWMSFLSGCCVRSDGPVLCKSG